MASDPFEDALAALEGGDDPFEAELSKLEQQPAGDANLAGATAATQAQTLGFADEIQAAAETVPYAAGEALAGRFEVADVVDYYKYRRDTYRKEAGELAESNPTATAVGTGVGIASQLVGVNPVSVARGLATGGSALLTREGLKAGGRALLSAGGAKAVGTGAAIGGAAGLGTSEEETLGGLAQDTLEGAETGAVIGGAARGLLGAGAQRTASQAAAAEEKAAAAVKSERNQALVRTGLEQKQNTLGGPKRAKARAQALVDEPLPGTDKKLVDVADELSPDARLELATTLRRGAGETLGKVRDQLGQARDVTVPVAPIREEIRTAFAKLPSETQERGLEQVDAMIGKLSKDGQLTPDALRKLIEDSEALAKFGTPNLEAALGQARGRVFQAARAVLVSREQELIQKVLPNEAERYGEALRQYGIFSDFELGSEQFLRRANKGQKIRPEPKAELSAGRRMGRELLKYGGAAAGGTIGGSIGGPVGAAAGTLAGATAGEVLAARFIKSAQPNAGLALSKLKKLERLGPMMEEALRNGPAEVARVHALFMAKSPDYRKAIESEE